MKARMEICGNPLKTLLLLVIWKRITIPEVMTLGIVKTKCMIQAIGEMGNPQAYRSKHRTPAQWRYWSNGKVHDQASTT